MKSKTVASIMRHVASKLPSGESGSSAPQQESGEGETRKSQKSKGDGEEQDDAVGGGGGGAGGGGGGGQNEESRLEHLYEQIAWPLGKKYGHPYDAFKLSLTCVFFWMASAHDILPTHTESKTLSFRRWRRPHQRPPGRS